MNTLLFILQNVLTIRLLDIIDILLMAFLLYQIYQLIKGTVAIYIFFGIISIYVIWKIMSAYEMELMSGIIGQFISVGIIAIIIVFQPEIRQFLLFLGKNKVIQKGSEVVMSFSKNENVEVAPEVEKIIKACVNMSKTYTGALIVISGRNELRSFIETGETINARISSQLLENIFFKNSPLHDGAAIIIGNEIRAARCILPVTQNQNVPVSLGLRHRAAIGLTEQSDASAIVVSEQTGHISFCKNGKLFRNINPEDLKNKIIDEINQMLG